PARGCRVPPSAGPRARGPRTEGDVGRRVEPVDKALFPGIAFGYRPVEMPIRFPSVAFFEALREQLRAERDRFARLGFFDTTFGIRVLGDPDDPPAEFLLAF